MKMGKEVGVSYTTGVPKVRSNMEPMVGFFCFSLVVVFIVVVMVEFFSDLTQSDLQ